LRCEHAAGFARLWRSDVCSKALRERAVEEVLCQRDAVVIAPTRKCGRPRTGHLELRGETWWCQLTITVDDESVRRWFNLKTRSKPAARRKMARLVAQNASGGVMGAESLAAEAQRAESLAEACERVHAARLADGEKSAKDEIARLRRYAIPDLGLLDVARIDAGHINAALDEAKNKGKGRETVQHLRQDLANVFSVLKRERVLDRNPADESELPNFSQEVRKVRAVLTDDELARYLAWTHPDETWRETTLERQVMACVARTFGGLRTGDLHALDWSALDTGPFAWVGRRVKRRGRRRSSRSRRCSARF
jgi:hypothetical protein